MGASSPPHELYTLCTTAARGAVTLCDKSYAALGAWLAQLQTQPQPEAHEHLPLTPAPAVEPTLDSIPVCIGWPPLQLAPPKLTLSGSPFGRTPYNLMMMLGIESVLCEAVVRQIRPACPRCGGTTERPVQLTPEQLPTQGWIAAVVRDGVTEVPLRERCELLGTERAYVAGRLVRVTDDEDFPDGVDAAAGEPVAVLESAERLRRDPAPLEGWFARGGGRLLLVHFTARDAVGVELGVRVQGLICTGCGSEVAGVHSADLYALPPCAQCAGAGWLESLSGGLAPCGVCDGHGSSDPLTTARCGEWRVRDLLAVTFDQFFRQLPGMTPSEQALGAAVSAAGLGGYPLGYPVAYAAPTERLCMALAIARRAQVRGALFVADAAALPALAATPEPPAWLTTAEPRAVLYTPADVSSGAQPLPVAVGAGCCAVELRDVGPFASTRVTFPCAAATLIQGPAGSGKSVALSEVRRLFAQRRRLAQLCAFPGLKRLTWIASYEPHGESVLDALMVWPAVAALAARSRQVQRLGFDPRELEVAHHRHPCPECVEGAGVRAVGSEPQGACQSCGGTGLHQRIVQLPLGGSSVGEVLTGTLEAAAELLWADDELCAVFAALPTPLKTQLRLISPLRWCAPADIRCLRVCAGLGRVRARAEGRRGAAGAEELVLLDTPCAGTGAQQHHIVTLFEQLLNRRVTLLCAGAPVGLESLFHHVIHLEVVSAPLEERRGSRTLESRFGRRSVVGSVAGQWHRM
jgi:hypothetical protein